MFIKMISRLTAKHAFFCHKEQQAYEDAFNSRKEKVLNYAFFSF